jgi:hypothetical protein
VPISAEGNLACEEIKKVAVLSPARGRKSKSPNNRKVGPKDHPLVNVVDITDSKPLTIPLRRGKYLPWGKAKPNFAHAKKSCPFHPAANFLFVPGKESIQVADSVIH